MKNTSMNFTIAELARAVNKSETYIRQHIYRKHLTAQKDGHNLSVALDEAVRWAQERRISIELPLHTSVSTGFIKGRVARITVLTWYTPNGQIRNLFTLVRHRRRDMLGPWTREQSKSWSCDELGHKLQLFYIDVSFESCQVLVDSILASGVLRIDDLEIHYSIESVPCRHWAYRDCRPISDASICSPFSKHSAEVFEYWSFSEEPKKHWLQVLESFPTKLPDGFTRLGFPLNRRPDRVGNLVIAAAEDQITCNLSANRDQTLRLDVEANEILPGAYNATVWASHCGDGILRQEVPITRGKTVIDLESDVDHIGFAIYRTVDGVCVDLMEAFLIKEVRVQMNLESGPSLQFQNRRGRVVHHKVDSPSSVNFINVQFDEDGEKLNRGIRQQWLERRIYEQEAAVRREGKFARFQPNEIEEAVRYFIGLLRQESDQMAPIYLADPYFLSNLKEDKLVPLYLDIFAATTGRPLRILCVQKEHNNTNPWWWNYPKHIANHVCIRAFFEHKSSKPGFHDRYLITPEREVIITNSLTGWLKQGVTFANLPYGVYRAEAERLWSMDIESNDTPLFVREVL